VPLGSRGVSVREHREQEAGTTFPSPVLAGLGSTICAMSRHRDEPPPVDYGTPRVDGPVPLVGDPGLPRLPGPDKRRWLRYRPGPLVVMLAIVLGLFILALVWSHVVGPPLQSRP
jgi:hypothetical protein